jgi:excisionase family DNA binding protein
MSTTTTTPNAKPYYSAKEAATILQVDPHTLRKWIRLGKLRANRIGDRGHLRIPAASIFRGGAVPQDPFVN